MKSANIAAAKIKFLLCFFMKFLTGGKMGRATMDEIIPTQEDRVIVAISAIIKTTNNEKEKNNCIGFLICVENKINGGIVSRR